MAVNRRVTEIAGRVSNVLDEYAREQGWHTDDYRVLVRLDPDWGQVHVVLIAKQFQIDDTNQQWKDAMHFLDRNLSDLLPGINSLLLTIRTFDQLEQGGIYGITPEFVDVHDLMTARREF